MKCLTVRAAVLTASPMQLRARHEYVPRDLSGDGMMMMMMTMMRDDKDDEDDDGDVGDVDRYVDQPAATELINISWLQLCSIFEPSGKSKFFIITIFFLITIFCHHHNLKRGVG